MGQFRDLTGQRFGRLVVIRKAEDRSSCNKIQWLCQCDCGNLTNVVSGSLLGGYTQSCGCLVTEKGRRVRDIVGQRYGKLVVKEYAGCKNKKQYWLCVCDCGKEKVLAYGDFYYGRTQSCGCWNSEYSTIRHTTHGMAFSDTYNIWGNMKRRCLNPKDAAYKWYGGRGITVCEKWLVFENFFKDMGPRPEGLTLDRIDNDGIYEPGNCRWVTMKEQMNNTRSNVIISVFGREMRRCDACRAAGINESTFRNRITRQGWFVEKALFAPLRVVRLGFEK